MRRTVNDLAKRLKRQFGDESGVQIEDSDIIMWVNDAVSEAVRFNPKMNLATRYLAAVAGKSVYSLESIDFSEIETVYSRGDESSLYVQMQKLSSVQFDEYVLPYEDNPSSIIPTGQPTFFAPSTRGRIKVYPAPATSDARGIRVTYNDFACSVENLTDALPFSERYFTFFLEFCLMKAYEMDEDWAAADRKAEFVQSSLNENFVQEHLAGDRYPSITVDRGDL